MKKFESGSADHVAIIVGLILGCLLVGFFISGSGLLSKLNFKSFLQLPCGLTYSGISDNQKITFPLQITGYVNGCGWDDQKGVAGTIQIFDAKGLPVTLPTPIDITDSGTQLPLAFTAIITPSAAPQTDNGELILKSNSGLLKIVPVTF